VAIVGRPNVGKSALFNRLVGKRLAIVEDVPGVTRDRLYALAEWRGRTFSVVDTGGIETGGAGGEIGAATREQAFLAARQANVLVFVVDGSDGLVGLDEEVAQIVRRARRPAILAVNKVESPAARASIAAEFSRLGFGEPVGVSAIHGEGTGDLLDAIVAQLPEGGGEVPPETLSLAIVGLPNVGKSSLVNALLGEERTIVSPTPGTTRDAIDAIFEFHEHRIRLIDTAGVWKNTQAHGQIEYYAALRSLAAIARADVVVLVIDALQGVLAQDRRLAGIALEEKKGLIIVANKWDLAREQGEYSQPELIKVIHEQLPFAAFTPVTFLSAKTRRRLGSLMPLVMRVAANLDRRIPTARLNDIVRRAVLAHPPPSPRGTPLRVYYCSQVETHPPLFLFHCNDPELVVPSYKRFIENIIRSEEDFEGVPLTLEFRAREREER
jgi:GTP-binding protein